MGTALAVSPRLPVREPDLRERVLWGVGMSSVLPARPIRHTILRPVGLRLAATDEDGVDWIEGDETLVWDKIELEYVDSRHVDGCIWDYIKLWDKPPAALVRFIQRWGLFTFGEDNKDVDRQAREQILEVRRSVLNAEAILTALVSTEESELVPDDVAQFLEDPSGRVQANEVFDRILSSPDGVAEYRRYLQQFREEDDPYSFVAHSRAMAEERRKYRQARIAAGEGIQHQKEMVVASIAEWIYPLALEASWDSLGRHLDLVATGVHEIVGAQLGQIFSSPSLDVYACSICGSIFQFKEVEGKRRPKRGARRFCSDRCRLEAKRLDNLAAWHRNKERWTNWSRSPKGVAHHGQAGQ